MDHAERMKIITSYDNVIAEAASLTHRVQRRDALIAALQILEQLPVSDDLEQNRRALERLLGDSSDWVQRTFHAGGQREALLAYFDGIVEMSSLEEYVIKPLMNQAGPVQAPFGIDAMYQALCRTVVPHSRIHFAANMREVIDGLLHGDAVVMLDGETTALIVSARAVPMRNVSEPETEAVVRGPREGFIENLRSNTALIRRRIRTPQLKMESVRVGRLSRTDVVICYIQGLAPDPIVREVKRRISRIDIDAVLDSATVEELVEDDPYSPFPQLISTERPDIVAANLLEGRVAILVDGSPFALIAPATLWTFLQASEDFYDRFYIGTFLRLLRLGLASVALLGPAFYVAVTTFHQEMLPSALLLTLAATREGIPFPSVVEALIMELLLEALREAGVRLPRNVGQAVSIVGALVIGQAAVQAGLVSSPMVIIVAVTGIASFTFPRFNFGIAIRLIRFPVVLLASVFGLYGIVICILAVLIHLAGLRSFGIPYLQPVAPLIPTDLADTVVRPPVWLRGTRPALTAYLNPRRQGRRIKPGPDPWERACGGDQE